MAIKCTRCGYQYNSEKREHCYRCGSRLDPGCIVESSDPERRYPDEPYVPVEQDVQSHLQDTTDDIFSGTVLEGRMTHVERNEEKISADFFEIAGKIIIGFNVVITFFFLFFFLILVCIVTSAFGFRNLTYIFNPMHWIRWVFYLIESIFGRRPVNRDTVPVYRGLIEHRSGQDCSFMMRGPIIGSNLIVGHQFRFEGEWEDGVFLIRQGINLSTSAAVSSGYRNPWKPIFIFILILYAIIFIIPYVSLLMGNIH